MPTKRVHVFISGDVQGVGFRWYAREQAYRHGVAGFIRNLPDGRVEAAFEGEESEVDAVVAWCRKGPEGARVNGFETEDEQPTGESEFRIARA